MPPRSLKNYQAYLDRLILFAQANGIKVAYGEIGTEGVWMPGVRRIKLDVDLAQSEELASLLHELGHSLDDILTLSDTKENGVHRAYHAVYNEKATKKQKALVLDFERRAWKNGRDIAKRLNIPLGKWFDEFELQCLNSYRGV